MNCGLDSVVSKNGFIVATFAHASLKCVIAVFTNLRITASSISKDDTENQVAVIQAKLEKTMVPFIVEVGEVQISIREFLTLGFGDVLQLGTKVKEDFKCRIGKNTKFLCRPGTSGKKMAVQITQIIEPEGDEETDER